MRAAGPHDSLASRIDHTLLRADATEPQIRRLCDEALEHGFAAVCVNSRWIGLVATLLRGSATAACSVVGFPLGAMLAPAKAVEAALAFEAGARELDMVLDLGAMLSGDDAAVRSDIEGVVAAAPAARVKVILETGLLDAAGIQRACVLAAEAGAHFVKTSSGFGPRGASVEDVRLMRAAVGDALGVKASGGIRDRRSALALVEAGADRLGSSSGVAIVGEADPA